MFTLGNINGRCTKCSALIWNGCYLVMQVISVEAKSVAVVVVSDKQRASDRVVVVVTFVQFSIDSHGYTQQKCTTVHQCACMEISPPHSQTFLPPVVAMWLVKSAKQAESRIG